MHVHARLAQMSKEWFTTLDRDLTQVQTVSEAIWEKNGTDGFKMQGFQHWPTFRGSYTRLALIDESRFCAVAVCLKYIPNNVTRASA